jgi:hypothetical protein
MKDINVEQGIPIQDANVEQGITMQDFMVALHQLCEDNFNLRNMFKGLRASHVHASFGQASPNNVVASKLATPAQQVVKEPQICLLDKLMAQSLSFMDLSIKFDSLSNYVVVL